jgi:hypothetical protein
MCLSAHSLNAHLAEFLLTQNVQQFCLLLLCTYAPAQCPPGRALRIFNDSVSSELTMKFFLCALFAPTQCPPGRALQNSQQNFLCNCVSSHTALPPEVFSNLKGLPPELLTSVLCRNTSLSNSTEFRSASSMHQYSESAVLCHALLA